MNRAQKVTLLIAAIAALILLILALTPGGSH